MEGSKVVHAGSQTLPESVVLHILEYICDPEITRAKIVLMSRVEPPDAGALGLLSEGWHTVDGPVGWISEGGWCERAIEFEGFWCASDAEPLWLSNRGDEHIARNFFCTQSIACNGPLEGARRPKAVFSIRATRTPTNGLQLSLVQSRHMRNPEFLGNVFLDRFMRTVGVDFGPSGKTYTYSHPISHLNHALLARLKKSVNVAHTVTEFATAPVSFGDLLGYWVRETGKPKCTTLRRDEELASLLHVVRNPLA